MSGWLAIDTSDQTCSVAYQASTHAQPQVYVSSGQEKNTEVILQGMQSVLPFEMAKMPRLDGVAVTVGPGSFSGVRVGCLMAQTIAALTESPLYALSTCAVWAEMAWMQQPALDYVAVAMDARMRETYWAVYQQANPGERTVVVKPCLVAMDAVSLPEQLASQSGAWVGSMLHNADWCQTMGMPESSVLHAPISADAILQYLWRVQRKSIAPEDLQPIYLRQPC